METSISTGDPGKPVLTVRCNYEKNYAFVKWFINLPLRRQPCFDGVYSACFPPL
ncbi:hypothetical protein EDD17DRAFT_1632012 [Pisolithus thermaeus]|nr:hypothetical protein EDD17DRAFT_1632012 [Pisolithus thermaeus]